MKRFLAAALVTATLAAVGCSKPAATYTPPVATPPKSDAPSVAPKGDTVTISAEEFIKKMKAGERMLVVDLRTEEEYGNGHVPGSKFLPFEKLKDGIARYGKNEEIYLIDMGGTKSAAAYTTLRNMGYTKLHVVIGGIVAYRQAGGLIEF